MNHSDHETSSSPHAGRPAIIAAALWLTLPAAFVAIYHGTFIWMWNRWFPAWRHTHLTFYQRITEGESYYTHAPLVPIISAVIILLLIRKTSIRVKPRRTLGIAIIALTLLIHLAAAYARIDFVSGFTIIPLAAGIIIALWGLAAMRRLWFPVALIAFMVPLPEVTIANLNYDLKMFAARWGVKLANLAGTIAVQDGNRVWLNGQRSLVVANVCNGLRTLISVIGFGALYAYVCRLRGIWRLLLFAAAIPVAVIANSIRIGSLIVVADRVSVETATGWYHDFSGLLIFVVAFMLMFSIENLIIRTRQLIGRPALILPLFHNVRRTDDDQLQTKRMFFSMNRPRGAVIIALMVITAALTLQLRRVGEPLWRGETAARAIPGQLLCDDRTWTGHTLMLDQTTLTILGTNDYLFRRYTGAGMPYVDFCIIFSQDNRKGTHPPDLCLQGSGEGIIHKRDLSVDVPGLGKLPCRELVVQNGQWQEYFLYTYKCGRSYTNSFWMQQFTILWNGLTNRNSSGALIRLSTPVEGGSRGQFDTARRRTADFLRATMVHVHQNLP